MTELTTATWNVHRLKASPRALADWHTIFHGHTDVIFLQELLVIARHTFQPIDLSSPTNAWQLACPAGLHHTAHRYYGNGFAGVLILNPSYSVIDVTIMERITSVVLNVSPGRNDQHLRFTSIYASVRHPDRALWAATHLSSITAKPEPHIIGGDWNDVPSPLDTNSHFASQNTVWADLGLALSSLTDVFRLLHPTAREFSHHQASHADALVSRRLDAIYASHHLPQTALTSRYVATNSSDHSIQFATFGIDGLSPSGSGRPMRFWLLTGILTSFPDFRVYMRSVLLQHISRFLALSRTKQTLTEFLQSVTAIRAHAQIASDNLSAHVRHLNRIFEDSHRKLNSMPHAMAADIRAFHAQALLVQRNASACGFLNHSSRLHLTPPPRLKLHRTAHSSALTTFDVISLFTQLFKPTEETPEVVAARQTLLGSHAVTLSANDSQHMARPFTQRELERELKAVKPGLAAGADGLSYDFWKISSAHTTQILTALLNNLASRPQTFPPNLPQFRGVLLHKGVKAVEDPTGYRPILIANAWTRIIDRPLAQRLQAVATLLFPHSQHGFLRNRSAWMCVMPVALSIAAFASGLTEHSAAVLISQDQQKAYDRINRAWLFQCLRHANVPRRIRQVFHTFYRHPTVRFAVGDNLAAPVPLERGIPQGMPSSCLIYNICYQPFLSLLQQRLQFHLGSTHLPSTTWADNTMVFLSEHDYDAYIDARNTYDLASDSALNESTEAYILTSRAESPPWAHSAAQSINHGRTSPEEFKYLGYSFHTGGLYSNLALGTQISKLQRILGQQLHWEVPTTVRIEWVNAHAMPLFWHAMALPPTDPSIYLLCLHRVV